MKFSLPPLPWLLSAAVLWTHGGLAQPTVTFDQPAGEVEAFDFVEVCVQVKGTEAKNPFVDAKMRGSFQITNGATLSVEGFCDSADGSRHCIRFMPPAPGTYSFTATYQEGSFNQTTSGKFNVKDGKRRGMLRVDRDHPWHFLWEGTREHYFWNGTTAYWLLGWEDDGIMHAAVDRFAALKVNRMRVALCGRTASGARWNEPQVQQTEKFKFRLNPWVAARPDSPDDPGFDVTRFNLPFWQRCERMLAKARQHDIIVSLIFYLDGKDKGVDPFGKAHAASDDEKRYYQYAVARLGAFSNVVWDLSNEYRHLRDDAWANVMGDFVKSCDPYDHLLSIHGHPDFSFRASPWADYCLYQQWDEHGGYDFMLKNRREQETTGHPKPQINEEYGYEDHYPVGWGGDRTAPARNADSRRRLAWEISMAGGYQTTGERANQGCGKPPDTGGGWITARGDDQMTMLGGYAKLAAFFTSFDWWKANPDNSCIREGNARCLVEPGKTFALYLPKGGSVTVALPPGKFQGQSCNCRTGEIKPLGEIPGGADWKSPVLEDGGGDWALLLRQ
ncbi:MAG: DUF4038 domain-containing protein [Verrucomicrobiales bacterium]|nr:DUF4038 domain-containing protein [Verrucomicrobiales bacterium]